MAARANVAYDRLLAVVLCCVLASCSSRGDTMVRTDIISVGSAREVRDAGGRGARRVWELVELEREANEMGRGAREGGE